MDGELAGLVLTCESHGGRFEVISEQVVGGPPEEPLQTYQVSVGGDDLNLG